MSIRYLYNIALGLAAGFLVVASVAFAAPTVAWLTFAIAAGITAVSAGLLLLPGALAQRSLTAATGLLGIWTIVASLVFTPGTVVSLGFASALAFVALAVAGLTLHELTTERVVHSFEVEGSRNRREEDSLIAA